MNTKPLQLALVLSTIGLLANAQTLEWAKQMGGTSYDEGRSIAVDAFGYIYTTGTFQSTADFDPGVDTFNLTSAGNSDIFISKLDASGNFVWAKKMGGTGSDVAKSIAIDVSGNVYTTGIFEGTVDFDPGADTTSLSSIGDDDIFISKLDTSGNFVWIKQIGGVNDDQGSSIAVDASGNVYTTGRFEDTVDFDPGSGTFYLTSAGTADIFISKINPSGDFIWAKQVGGIGLDGGFSIALDASENIYTTGYFRNTVDFNPGIDTFDLISAGFWDIFIFKLDTAGNFIWAKQVGGIGSDAGNSIAVSVSGNVYITGDFLLGCDFDPGYSTFNLMSKGLDDIFVSKLDASGNFVWAKKMGGTSNDQGYSIALDVSESVYVTGYFRGTVDFDPGVETFNLTSAGGEDVFISKLDASGNLIWAKRMGGTGWEGGRSLTVDASGNVYTTGWFTGTADFGLETGVSNLHSAGFLNIFVQKLSQKQ